MSVSGTYQYLRSGTAGTISGSTAYSVSTGGAVLLYDDGSLKTIRQLQKVALTQLSDRYAMAGNQKYLLDENVQVLLQGSGGCYATTTLIDRPRKRVRRLTPSDSSSSVSVRSSRCGAS